MLSMLVAAAAVAISMTAQGPQGPLAGTLLDAGAKTPLVLIIPGSGPTDRDGNNPMGVAAAPYRLLAEALAAKGVSSVRIDKRGLFGSKAAVLDPNNVTISDYATDTHKWVAAIRRQTGASCLFVLGHSEGALVALAAAQDASGIAESSQSPALGGSSATSFANSCDPTLRMRRCSILQWPRSTSSSLASTST